MQTWEFGPKHFGSKNAPNASTPRALSAAPIKIVVEEEHYGTFMRERSSSTMETQGHRMLLWIQLFYKFCLASSLPRWMREFFVSSSSTTATWAFYVVVQISSFISWYFGPHSVLADISGRRFFADDCKWRLYVLTCLYTIGYDNW